MSFHMNLMFILTAFTFVLLLLLCLYVHNRRLDRTTRKAFPPAGEYVEAEHIRLHFTSKGTGRPIVFLHGGILSSRDFSNVVSEAASRGFRAIAFDRPGYGYSERPKTEWATPRVQARLLKEALRKLEAKQPILVGHSWSASLVLAYMLDYPGELAGAVLVAPGAYGGKAYPAGAIDLFLGRLLRVPFLGSLAAHTVLPPLARKLTSTMLQSTFSPDKVPDGYQKIANALWSRPSQLRANREDILAFAQTIPAMEQHYSRIQTPTVIVCGEKDPFRPDLHAYRLHREISHSRLIVLPDTGHMIPALRQAAVVDAVELLIREMEDSLHVK
ncbi:alpha/beta hydrolase [Brevibacillus borstelensis]|uniref:alpha/beta fold hydrolase n=1 Tax=Brevibacillus borstelensis TaxID=45462 RepID=UPI0030CF6C52